MALKPFPKGVSGNPGGRRKKPLVTRALEEVLTCNDSAKAKQIAEKLISSAVHGSIAAAKLIVEHTEGRPARNPADSEQKVEVRLTPEQINQQLSQLLRDPALKERLVRLMTPEDKVIQ